MGILDENLLDLNMKINELAGPVQMKMVKIFSKANTMTLSVEETIILRKVLDMCQDLDTKLEKIIAEFPIHNDIDVAIKVYKMLTNFVSKAEKLAFEFLDAKSVIIKDLWS